MTSLTVCMCDVGMCSARLIDMRALEAQASYALLTFLNQADILQHSQEYTVR